jgi:murein DD-endopeptidase MepM/ murein hydrolase activator NlpD
MNIDTGSALKDYIQAHPADIGKVVDFDRSKDRLLHFNFTETNMLLSPATIADTDLFSRWVEDQLRVTQSRYGIGGYDEHRTIYARSSHFDNEAEARRLHLGVDIWGPAGTPVYNPIAAKVHSFQFNDHFGDYGATIILEHQLNGHKIHSLYGHLNLASLNGLQEGQFIPKGEKFAEFGIPAENGHWPPHLHFQLIVDMKHFKGDYPGVCRFSEKEEYLENSPDPNDILAFTF